MTKQAHGLRGAPLPWRASSNNTNALSTVHDADGLCIGTADSRNAGMDAPAIALLFAAAPEMADALEALLADATDTYCECCQMHAPKDDRGVPTGPIAHEENCPAAEAFAALRKAGRSE